MIRTILTATVGILLVTPVSARAATDAGALELVDEAISLLQEEVELVPLVNPERSGEADFAGNRSRFMEIEAAGERVEAEFDAYGIELTPAITTTLGFAEPSEADASADMPPRPPGPDVYATAITDLRRIAQQLPTATESGSGSGSGSDGIWTRTSELAVVAVGVAALAGLIALRRHHRRSARDLEAQVLTDPLTGVGNRRRLDRDIDRMEADVEDVLAVLMIDIDHFKRFNDQHGHRTGDAVLQRVGAVVSEQVQRADAVYRYGGEEFCVLMPGADDDVAGQIARRICRAVGEVDVPVGADRVTVSIGVAVGERQQARDTITHADAALYRAKADGRDRVVHDTAVPATT